MSVDACRTCDGTGLIETAAHDSRVIHHEPCPDCGAALSPDRSGAGRRLWETLHAALGVAGDLDHWWQFAWDELPAELHDELVDAALRQGQAERDALAAALVQEYADVLARRGAWAEQHFLRRMGARSALERVAERLGVTNLHDQAADVVARGEEQR